MTGTKALGFGVLVAIAIWAGMRYNDKAEVKHEEENRRLEETQQQEINRIMEQFKIEDVVVGTGEEVKTGDTITAHYRGTFTDGTEFDSSYKGGQPFTVQIGAGRVIQGWDLGIPGMKVGGKRKLIIPSELAYGPNGYGPIPPNATLQFEIELLAVTSTPQGQ